MPDSVNLRHKKSASHTFATSSEAFQPRAAESETLRGGSCRRSNTSEGSGACSTSTSVPRGITTSEEECSEIQQQSRRNSQIKVRDRPSILRLRGPNRRRLKLSKNAETAHEVRQTAENSTAQSHQSPKRRRLEPTTPPGGANEARQADSVVNLHLINYIHPQFKDVLYLIYTLRRQTKQDRTSQQHRPRQLIQVPLLKLPK